MMAIGGMDKERTMPDARSILRQKTGRAIISVTPDTMVLEAAHVMNLEHIGALMVMEGDDLVGVFTERDVLTRIVAARRDPAATPVRDVMSTPVICAAPNSTRAELAAIMTQKRVRHLPVADEGRVIGVVSIGDLNRSENREQAETITYMEQYLL